MTAPALSLLTAAYLLTSSAVTAKVALSHHWSVATERGDDTRLAKVAFTLIGTGNTRRLPILLLSFNGDAWAAVLTCGKRLHSGEVRMSWDGAVETAIWRLTDDDGALFAINAERFITRLMKCRTLAVEFPLDGESRPASFDVSNLEKEIAQFPQAKKALLRQTPRDQTQITSPPSTWRESSGIGCT